MRVLIVSKFYYHRGGDCLVAMNTERLLLEHGHDVGVMCMHHPSNADTPSPRWEASQVDFSGSLRSRIKALRRTLGQGDIGHTVAQVLDEFAPQVVHLHNVHSYLSPLIAREAHQRGCRVVWTMHDYKLLCPAYNFMRPDGSLCQQCLHGDSRGVVKHRCMKGSLAASTAGWLEARRWPLHRLSQWVHTFICPSQFMAEKIMDAGVEKAQVAVLPNFIPQNELRQLTPSERREPYYCYAGRLSTEKGVVWLLQAAATLPHRIKVAGDGPLSDALKQAFGDCPNIEFLGHLSRPQIIDLLAHARLSVTPSLWWENNPLSVMEALCAGTPVVGTRLGGIPELLHPGNGIEVDPDRKPATLAQAIAQAWDHDWDHRAISRQAHDTFSSQNHYQQLIALYRSGSAAIDEELSIEG